MNPIYFFTQVAILAIAGIIAGLVSWNFIKNDIRKYVLLKAQPAAAGESNALLPLRLQAHERIILFVERLNPANLFMRLHQPGSSAQQLQVLVLQEIRSEYQHNVTQQLYVSAASWEILCKLKEDTIAMINGAVATLPEAASGTDLSRKVLEHMAAIGANPYDLTLQLIKQDIHQLF